MNAEPRSVASEGAEGAFAALFLVVLVRHQAMTASAACAGLARVLGGVLAMGMILEGRSSRPFGRPWGPLPVLLVALPVLLFVPCADGSLLFWQPLVGAAACWVASRAGRRPFPHVLGWGTGGLLALGWETGRLAASSLAWVAVVLGLLSAWGALRSDSGAGERAGARQGDELPRALLLFVLASGSGLWLVLAADFLPEGAVALAALVVALAFTPVGGATVEAARPDLSRRVLLAGLMVLMAVIWRFRAALHPLCEDFLHPWLWGGPALAFFRCGLRRETDAGGGILAGGAVALGLLLAPFLAVRADPSALLVGGAVILLLLAWAVVPAGEAARRAFVLSRGLALTGAGLMLVALHDGLEELRRPGRRTSLSAKGEVVVLRHVGTGPGRLVVGRGVGGALLASRGEGPGRLDDPLRAEGGFAAMVGAWLAPRRERVALLGPRAVFTCPAFVDLGFATILLPEPDEMVRGLLRQGVGPADRRRLQPIDGGPESLVRGEAFRGVDLVFSTLLARDLSPAVLGLLADGLAPFGVLMQQVDEKVGREGLARLVAIWRSVLDEAVLLRGERGLLLVGGRRGNRDTERPVLRLRALDWPAVPSPWAKRHASVLETVSRIFATTAELDEIRRGGEAWSRIRFGGGPVPIWGRAMGRVGAWCEGGGERDLRFADGGTLKRGDPPARLERSGMEPQLLETEGRRLVQPRVWMTVRCGELSLRWSIRPLPGTPFETSSSPRDGAERILLPCLGEERPFRVELSAESFCLVGEWVAPERSVVHEIRVEAPRDRGGDMEGIRALLARLVRPEAQI